jgi:hypothetical protein
MDKRRSEKPQEEPADKAARITAQSTVWIAIFTFVILLANLGTLWVLKKQLGEMQSGGVDTHNLAVAAGAQALSTQDLALFTAAQADRTKELVDRMKDQAEGTHRLGIAALASNRAWVYPDQMILGTPVELGVPLMYAIRIENPSKQPALKVVWMVKPYGVAYVPQGSTYDWTNLPPNTSCSRLVPDALKGIVLYPTTGLVGGAVPTRIGDTPENRQLIDEVIKKEKSLVIEGCFAYETEGQRHTSSFRFFLRDTSGPSFIKNNQGNLVDAWSFNTTLTGNAAD